MLKDVGMIKKIEAELKEGRDCFSEMEEELFERERVYDKKILNDP